MSFALNFSSNIMCVENDQIEEIKDVIEIATTLSTTVHGRTFTTLRTKVAEEIFFKVIGNAESILQLLPRKEQQKNGRRLFDPPSFASLTRDLMEACDVFQYLCVQRPRREEWEFRYYLYELNHAIEREKVIALMGIKESDFRGGSAVVEFLVDKLQGDSFFSSLSSKEQNSILKGHKAFFRNSARYLTPRTVPLEKRKALYKFFSH
ncbi:MAG: hypothetical protein ISS63_15840 [Desulfobacteraceae bacterium]|nr:hypothetical protein [Desulfobacteraceae bacterium]